MMKYATEFIKMPTLEESELITKKFESMCHFPQVLLVIDGTHIPVLAPKEGYGDFINRKGWPSYNVQIVCDADYV